VCKTPDIVLVVVDALGTNPPILGSPQDASPLIGAWIGQARSFSNCRTVCGSPLPSLVSILTGQPPGSHGVVWPGRTGWPPTLAAAFATTHQRCFLYQLDQWSETNPLLLDQDPQLSDFEVVARFSRPEPLFDEACRRLRPGGGEAGRPRLLVLQTSMLRGEMYADLGRAAGGVPVSRAVDAPGIRELDRQLSRLFGAIDFGHTVVILVGSHGRRFGSAYGRLGHGHGLGDDLLRVPLCLWLPAGYGIEPGRDDRLCSTLDIAPTLLALGGHAAGELPGWSLLGAVPAPHRTLAFEDWAAEGAGSRLVAEASLTWPLKQVSMAAGGEGKQWYNLASDPGEERELLALPPPNGLPSVSIVVVIDDRREFEMHAGESPLLTGGRHQRILIDNTGNRISPDICRIYAEAMAEADGRLVVFAHQDVFFPPGWEQDFAKAIAMLERHDPNWGVLGSVGVPTSATTDSGWRAVGHWAGPAGYGRTESLPAVVQSLDEQWLCLRKESGLEFDPRLPGFHCYGMDICLSAAARGMHCYAIDAFVWHKRRGPDGRLVMAAQECRKIARRQQPAFIAEVQPGYRYVGEKWRERIPFISTSMAWTDPNNLVFSGPRASFRPPPEA